MERISAQHLARVIIDTTSKWRRVKFQAKWGSVSWPPSPVVKARLPAYGIHNKIYTPFVLIDAWFGFHNSSYIHLPMSLRVVDLAFSCRPQCPWWRHQMKTFSALLAFCAAVAGEFPAQRPVMRSFDVFFDLRLHKRLSKQSWGWWFETLSCSLWRHRNE